ncbi:8344_t:CDS:2, partial [Paraglomus occultum]
VLGAFGLLGGIWSIIAGLYAFLLGGDVISPWGCVQSYCCCFIRSTRSKLDKEFPVVPFQSSKNLPESGSESSSQTEETTELKNRLDALEVFIQEYIVDTGYLDGVKKDECPNRVSAWLSRIKLKKSNSREIQGMSETPTQTGHNSTSSSIPPSQYPPSPHSDSDQLDTHTSDLLVRQDQSQPAQQEHGSQSMSDFDQNPTSVVGTVTDVRSNQSLYTAAAAQLSYTGQER